MTAKGYYLLNNCCSRRNKEVCYKPDWAGQNYFLRLFLCFSKHMEEGQLLYSDLDWKHLFIRFYVFQKHTKSLFTSVAFYYFRTPWKICLLWPKIMTKPWKKKKKWPLSNWPSRMLANKTPKDIWKKKLKFWWLQILFNVLAPCWTLLYSNNFVLESIKQFSHMH